MADERSDKITILGKGSMDHLSDALNLLLSMAPTDSEGNAVLMDVDLEEWRLQVREQMKNHGIDTDALQSLSTPSKVVSVGIKDNRIFLSIDRPEEVADDAPHIEDYIAFFHWILDDDAIVDGADYDIIDVERIRTYRVDEIEFPIDPVNNKVWKLQEEHINQPLDINSTKSGTSKNVFIVFRLNWDDLGEGVTITTPPDAYDKTVYEAINAIYQSGQSVMTLAMIYNATGKDGIPGQSDKQRINDSITKMNRAHIFINNEQEVKNNYKYPSIVFDTQLLPMRRVRVMLNGTIVDGAIKISDELPLFQFARGRSQLTTISRRVLQAPLNQTKNNLELQDYLIRRISEARTGHGKKKILYKTIFDRCGITSTKQRQRALMKIKQLMDHYIECGDLITGATYSPDGVTVTPKRKATTTARK